MYDTSATTTTTSAAAAAALEVFQLVVCVSAMWSRHRDSLRAMACEGEIGGEEAQLVVGCFIIMTILAISIQHVVS